MSQDSVEQAIRYLREVTDIADFRARVDRGGFLRTATRSHLEQLFDLSSRESEEACDRFCGEGEQ